MFDDNPFCTNITECYLQNGKEHGAIKYVLWGRDKSNQIQLKQFVKGELFEGKGYCGYYQIYTNNGHVKKEGYEKGTRKFGEQKFYSQHSIDYGNRNTQGHYLWY